METDPQDRAERIFQDALDRPPVERARFLEEACGSFFGQRRASQSREGCALAHPREARPYSAAIFA